MASPTFLSSSSRSLSLFSLKSSEEAPLLTTILRNTSLTRHFSLKWIGLILTTTALIIFLTQSKAISLVSAPIPSKTRYMIYSDEVKERLREAVKHQEHTSYDKLAPFVPLKAVYEYAPKYRLATCHIEKSMSTLLVGLFCYLFDPEHFVASKRSILTEWWGTRLCKGQNEAFNQTDLDMVMPDRHHTFFVVRDPVDRFISGFVNKCLDDLQYTLNRCYKCNASVSCVIKNVRKELSYISTEKRPNMTFESRHFAPHTWYCNLKERFEDYIFIKYASGGPEKIKMAEDFSQVLRDHGVPEENIETVYETLTHKSESIHRTVGSKRRQAVEDEIRGNPAHMAAITELYKDDYKIFGFPLPSKEI